MTQSEWTFKIKRSEFGKYSTAGITLNLPQEDLDKFSPAAIERAKELKAKHGNKYTDGYYLDYAKSLELQDIIGANNEIHKNRVGRCDIKDSNWAGYSYDEIIEMANNGYKVPEEILQWAYSQQQTDVTDYVMVSDATAAEDETASATGAGTSELSNLQQKARQNITRTEEATKRTEQKVQEYQLTADKAKEIKKNKENSYKDSMNEINTLTKEWKKLDDKKKNGTLSIIEKKRYADLSKKLNGSDGSLMKEIQVDNSDLESFLDKLDGLNTEIDNNITIAHETIQAGTDLSNYEKQYHQEQLPKMTSGVQADGTGLLSDTLYGMKGDKIADLAIEKGSDLDELSTNLSGELTSGDNQKLTEFAQDYTSIASKTEEETKNVMGEEFDKPTDENEEQKKNVKTYNVDIAFTYQNAQKATITTAQATADLLSNNSSTETSNKSLKKELKKLQKDIKDITKESTEAKQTQEKNVTKEEEFLTELETLQEQPAVQTDKKENKNTTASTTDSKSGEKQAVLDEAENVHNENNTIQEKVKKALSKGVQSNTKSQKLTKVLTDNNNDLVKRNNNTQDVASKTIVVGAGTFTKSFITTAIGESMFATGVSLMSNPMTYSSGLALSIAGRMLQVQGQQEFVNGIAATASGAAGLIASATASDTNTEAKTSLKDAAKIFKDNKQVFKEAAAEDTQASENPAETSGNDEITEPETETQENTETENPEVTTADTTEEAETTEKEEQEDSETTDENNTQQNKKEDKGYSVSLEFTSANSIKAAQTTNQATQDLNNNKADTDKLNTTVQSETKKSEKLVKDVDKETAQTEAKQAVNTQQSQAVTEKITTVQAQMQNASSTDEADSSQTEMQALSTQLDGTITEGEQLNTAVNKSLAKSIQQLDKFHKNTQDLTKNIPDFDKKIANQLDVSQKTLGVGIGTGINGGIHTFQGTQMITEGTILMANPFTHALGVLTTAMGALTLAQGMTEITTGTVAAATGTNGIIENGKAKDSAKEAEIAEKTSKAQEKDSNKKIDEAKKSLDENNEITEQPQTALENSNIEQENTEDDITAISASASTNANLNDTTTTDDKADRKLSRFNTESIIESKKKKKKVQAVLASSTNSKK